MTGSPADRAAVVDGAAALDSLFAYGTLMVPRIFTAVSGTSRAPRAAELADYARYRVRGAVYPGLVPEPGARTRGCLLGGLDQALWHRLDDFEGALYARRAVEVELSDGQRCAAWTYVVTASGRATLTRQPWSLATFERRHLAVYLARWTVAPAATTRP